VGVVGVFYYLGEEVAGMPEKKGYLRKRNMLNTIITAV
jgi:hypothetical protein